MRHTKALLAGSILGFCPVAILYTGGFWDPLLSVFIWASFSTIGYLLVRRKDEIQNSNPWWSVLHVFLVVGGAFLGAHTELPYPEDLAIALSFLILGVGWASMLIGIQMRHEMSETRTESSTLTAD
ncbi:hypothetical protein [Halalkalicoccus subterraneus]|uniref:hypothetical protein n=1 Tax=Halalkalicoccus subterraneus TaxID=2675002 RepID=UPI0013CE86C6|nr:hypothetical protein [Halalkalicoccus subterraneus]